MLDCVIRGGEVIDGTGRPRRRADVGIRDGRIVAIGDVSEEAAQTIDASGCVVAPGFVDIHTHYDAQAFWDTTLSPSPLHGVTTVIGGNCGFSIAPLGPGAGDYLMKMLARVEGMPLESLAQGVPWDWTTTAEYLDRLDGVARGERRLPRRTLRDPARRDGRRGDAVGTRRPASSTRWSDCSPRVSPAGGMGFSSSWAHRPTTTTRANRCPRVTRADGRADRAAQGRVRARRHDARVHPHDRAVRRARHGAHDATCRSRRTVR